MPERIPLIGVMAHRRKSAKLPFAEAGFFANLINEGKVLGVKVFVFSPLEINWAHQRVIGWTPNNSIKTWQRNFYPFPDVVYDRLFPGKGDVNAALWRYAKSLRDSGEVIWMNSSLHGKWDVYKTLALKKEIRPYIPETIIFSDIDALLKMLQKYETVFIKPNMGTQGKGVMRLQISPSRVVRYKGRTRGGRSVAGVAGSLDELILILRAFMGERKFLIQQGLSLRVYHNAPCDVRVVVQKGVNGKWVITGHAVRVGPTEGVTSNLHGGGTAKKLIRVLREIGETDFNAQFIIAEIEDLAIKVARELDRESNKFAEFGLDVGLDTKKRVWLIEVNSKPGRKVFLHTGDYEARHNSIVNPLHYGQYLLAKKYSRYEKIYDRRGFSGGL
ncbi:YheC/YheD family protein [Clostridium sp. 'deep sea']|uniref:YheC/YheD family endospore coat-associated protein n=1 Tax=Clostridium sp. 'deep sea' TaxID=2779445 RepID=UPI0018966284|nr:YheC/YheD family protein [Clostridium sp. 'deep sea']QOR36597.1 YheC/YheD family protein [Clostridium sp. 'deep sea']